MTALLVHGERAVTRFAAELLRRDDAPGLAVLLDVASELVAGLLCEAGYDATVVCLDEARAVDALLARRPELVLMDAGALARLLIRVGELERRAATASKLARCALNGMDTPRQHPPRDKGGPL